MDKSAGTIGGGTEIKQETRQWRLRDTLAAALLFLGSAAWVVWQNTRVAVLWDLGYLLDTSWRVALRQMPYRDFPLVHAPGTFLIQAALMKVFGRHYVVQVLYAATMSGLGSVLTWRIVLRVLRRAWGAALLLAAPLVVVGVYAVYPHPIYDCDCALAVLLPVWLLLRVEDARGWGLPLCAGTACVLPLLCKQNVGLPFLAVIAAGLGLVAGVGWYREPSGAVLRGACLRVLAGMAGALALAVAAIAATAGLHNYFYWTVEFAAQRRMPGMASMVGVYAQPAFVWTVPVTAVGLGLCWGRGVKRAWVRGVGFVLMAAPFAWSLIFLLVQEDADERADQVLSLWPLWMLAAVVVAAFGLRRGVSLRALMPFFILTAIHGTLLSQQLWGSTYALWPLLVVLVAFVLAELPRRVAVAIAATVSIPFAVCGGLYAGSLERLNYIDVPDGPVARAMTPALRGMATPGPYLANFDELIAYSEREIPRGDALLLLPGEDPFYFATGRTPRFPVTLFDPATDPYGPAELMEETRRRDVRWVIVKRVLQSKANVMPGFEETMGLVERDFVLDRRLGGYDVYRRR